jgi:hypothetical protein
VKRHDEVANANGMRNRCGLNVGKLVDRRNEVPSFEFRVPSFEFRVRRFDAKLGSV